MRGFLQHQYGVDLEKVIWAAHDDPHVAEAADPPTIERFSLGGKNLGELLAEGQFSAAILGNVLPNDSRVKPLIENSEEAALAWWRETGALPINHMFVMNSEICRTRPDVVREMFRILVESKKAAGKPKGDLDFLPFGFDKVRRPLEIAIQYAYEQKLIPRKLAVEELFDETTRALSEDQ